MQVRTMRLAQALTLLLTFCSLAYAGPEHGAVRGSVQISGMTSYRGVAALWKTDHRAPDPRRFILIPFTTQPLQTSGNFELQAPPGDYYVGVIVRQGEGGWQGPPRPGDHVFLSPDSKGNAMQVSVSSGAIVQVGRHNNGWVYEGMTAAADELYVSGRVVDERGEPLSGLMVFAFLDAEMSRSPLVVSLPTDALGHYRMQFNQPSTVYLRVRDQYGQRNPTAGGYMGVYGGKTAIPVQVDNTHEHSTLEIQAIKVPPLEQRGENSIKIRQNPNEIKINKE